MFHNITGLLEMAVCCAKPPYQVTALREREVAQGLKGNTVAAVGGQRLHGRMADKLYGRMADASYGGFALAIHPQTEP